MILDEDYRFAFSTLRNDSPGGDFPNERLRHRSVSENDFSVKGEQGTFYRLTHETTVVYSTDIRNPTVTDELNFRKLESGLENQSEDSSNELLVVETRVNHMMGVDFRARGSTIMPLYVQDQIIRNFPRRTKGIIELSRRFIDPSTNARTLTFDILGRKKKDVNSYESF